MRVSGISTRLRDRVLFGMLRVIFIKENSKMIWPTVTANTLISTDPSIKESLKTMSRKAMARRSGSTALSMSDPT